MTESGDLPVVVVDVDALLGPLVAPERAMVMAEGAQLARVMRAAEAMAWPPVWLREVWLWVAWLYVVRGHRGATTIATYVGIVARFREWVLDAERDYRTLSLADLDQWQKALYIERRSVGAYRRLQLSALRSFYSWRASRGLGDDVTAGMIGPRQVVRTARKYSTAQLQALVAAAETAKFPLTRRRNRMLVVLLLSTGLRREEISGLRVDDLELSGNTGIVRVWGKGAKEREIPIEGPVVRELHEWLLLRAEIPRLSADTVFVNTIAPHLGVQMMPSAVENAITRMARSAGLSEWGVHRFRVTFATALYDQGADIERIRIVMGHNSIETTRRYLAVSRRMRDVRLKPHTQHQILGTRAAGFPLWAAHLQEKGKGNG